MTNDTLRHILSIPLSFLFWGAIAALIKQKRDQRRRTPWR
jgi:hypothetical protein